MKMREDRRAICQINYVRKKNKKNINEKKKSSYTIDWFILDDIWVDYLNSEFDDDMAVVLKL